MRTLQILKLLFLGLACGALLLELDPIMVDAIMLRIRSRGLAV